MIVNNKKTHNNYFKFSAFCEFAQHSAPIIDNSIIQMRSKRIRFGKFANKS